MRACLVLPSFSLISRPLSEKFAIRSAWAHYKAILEVARVRKRRFEEGRMVGLAEGADQAGWDQIETAPGLHRSMDHVCQAGK